MDFKNCTLELTRRSLFLAFFPSCLCPSSPLGVLFSAINRFYLHNRMFLLSVFIKYILFITENVITFECYQTFKDGARALLARAVIDWKTI